MGYAPSTSSSFKSNEAYAQADAAARGSTEFAAQAANGESRIVVEQVRLSDALGPSYASDVTGVTRQTGGTIGSTDFTGGGVVAIYVRTPDGGYALRTMYPAPR